MRIVLISNIYDPHLSPFCEALSRTPNIQFSFIACSNPEAVTCSAIANKKIGAGSLPDFVFLAWENCEAWKAAKKIVNDANVIIIGSGDEALLPDPIGQRLLFVYSERPFKKSSLLLLRRIKLHCSMRKISKASAGCLCASAYSREDFSSAHLFSNHFLKWGYFPDGNLGVDLSQKIIGQHNYLRLYWSGRMLDWKRPTLILDFALELKALNIPFYLDVAGEGPLMPEMVALTSKMCLDKEVKFLGFLSNDDNLRNLSMADVVMFTSNRQEGWGATVNEAMSSKTVLIASSEAGSVPFLVEDGVNGYIFSDKDSFLNIAPRLQDSASNNRIALVARRTIEERWNGKIAAANFLHQVNSIIEKKGFDTEIPISEPGSLIL